MVETSRDLYEAESMVLKGLIATPIGPALGGAAYLIPKPPAQQAILGNSPHASGRSGLVHNICG
jgi:hypothetical protein